MADGISLNSLGKRENLEEEDIFLTSYKNGGNHTEGLVTAGQISGFVNTNLNLPGNYAGKSDFEDAYDKLIHLICAENGSLNLPDRYRNLLNRVMPENENAKNILEDHQYETWIQEFKTKNSSLDDRLTKVEKPITKYVNGIPLQVESLGDFIYNKGNAKDDTTSLILNDNAKNYTQFLVEVQPTKTDGVSADHFPYQSQILRVQIGNWHGMKDAWKYGFSYYFSPQYYQSTAAVIYSPSEERKVTYCTHSIDEKKGGWTKAVFKDIDVTTSFRYWIYGIKTAPLKG